MRDDAAVGMAFLDHVAGRVVRLRVDVAVRVAHGDQAAQAIVVIACDRAGCALLAIAARLALADDLVVGVVAIDVDAACAVQRACAHEVAPAVSCARPVCGCALQK